MSAPKQARNYCFTLNNWTEAELKSLKDWDSIKYCVVGKEVGENKTPHLQGYMEFAQPMRFSTIKGKFPRIHLEARRGSAKQAADYCKKDGNFEEWGQISKQGARTDIHDFSDGIKAGKRMRDLAMDDPVTFIKYHKGFGAFKRLVDKKRDEKPYVEWRYGPTGVGKTFAVVSRYGQDNVYMKDCSKWWDGYDDEPIVLWDDFDATDFKMADNREFLRAIDQYAYSGQIKGGYVNINPKGIYITCEHPPSHFWSDTFLAQVMRRIDCVVHCTSLEEAADIVHGQQQVCNICDTCYGSRGVILTRDYCNRCSASLLWLIPRSLSWTTKKRRRASSATTTTWVSMSLHLLMHL